MGALENEIIVVIKKFIPHIYQDLQVNTFKIDTCHVSYLYG